mgnify:CR=1 FL=1
MTSAAVHQLDQFFMIITGSLCMAIQTEAHVKDLRVFINLHFAQIAVAVLAIDLDRLGVLALEVAVAVVVDLEVTVDAVHPLLEVDVLEVHGLPGALGRALDRRADRGHAGRAARLPRGTPYSARGRA